MDNYISFLFTHFSSHIENKFPNIKHNAIRGCYDFELPYASPRKLNNRLFWPDDGKYQQLSNFNLYWYENNASIEIVSAKKTFLKLHVNKEGSVNGQNSAKIKRQ